MDPLIPKAVWGFNGTEGLVRSTLQPVAAAHSQKGIPAYKIYGKEVQDADDESIPSDVQEKIFSIYSIGACGFHHAGKVISFHGGYFYGNRRLYRGSKFLRGFSRYAG